MKSRISLFSVLAVLLVALLAVHLPAEQPTAPEAMVVSQTLTPSATAQAGDKAEGDADGLTWRERRKLGITRVAVIRATIKLAKTGQLPSTKGLSGDDLDAAKAEIKDAISAEIMSDNVKAWGESVGDGRDWSSFFEALASFLERIMPLIQQLIDIFGGFAHDATLTPSCTVADCMPVVSPPIALAA